ncbi:MULTISPECIES: bifunctional diguanylate cyclase/phosphodiesterase [unclassified Thioalkalivibrio]|uniref:bifunctional diguanylate cyclase/phosphodiesterase n=1 Tax=unclassified Thioalkalivibrio TaxID=2621013 RepID=UPI0003643A42|nr:MULTISPECIES: bifunctional diguanylate cyclase/phosphodiesterase [unclassified Thioalkalivibrio]
MIEVLAEESGEARALRAIIADERLTVNFQPIVDTSRQTIHGYEALVRGPESSSLHSPVHLFEVATQTGLLVELDLLCRRLAIQRFVALGLPGRLFLNVMPTTIVERDFREGLTLSFLRDADLAPNRVVIELTEHMPIQDYELMHQAVAHYREMGFHVALDDLGAGHSSLRHWSELRPDFVKLDRHFVAGIDQAPAKREFLRSILDVARSLDCQLIVEGIETEEEHRCLWELDRGLSLFQGFFFARPSATPPLSIERLLPGHVPRRTEGTRLASSIAHRVVEVPPDLSVPAVIERFRQDPTLRCVPVVERGRPVSVVRRDAFLILFTNPFSHSLYSNRRIGELADPSMLVFTDDTPLAKLSQSITGSQDERHSDFVIVDGEGHYRGMGNIVDLLREITEIQIRQARHANPLTGLPGNMLINEALERWLVEGRPFVALYCDLDNFKAFNDAYGYARGDRLLIALARLMQAQVGDEDFVGHVGGDDFMLLLMAEGWEATCQRILERFAAVVPEFYDRPDLKAGGLRAENRQGVEVFFPLVTLSLAARPVLPGGLENALDIATELSELKTQAKKQMGNSLFVDRRIR